MVEYGFVLNKSEFRDAVSLGNNKTLRELPNNRPCGQHFNLIHALNVKLEDLLYYVTIISETFKRTRWKRCAQTLKLSRNL